RKSAERPAEANLLPCTATPFPAHPSGIDLPSYSLGRFASPAIRSSPSATDRRRMCSRAQCLAVHCAQTTATGTRVDAVIDVVVVAFQSSAHLRLCVEPLAGEHDLNVVVVD